jgi:hypothetical protein
MFTDPGSKPQAKKQSKPPAHQGGEAANRWARDTPSRTAVTTNLPRLTPHPQPKTSVLPHLRPQPQGHQPSQVRDTKGNADRHRAAAFKRSKEYKRDVRASYDAQTTRQRSAVISNVQRLTPHPQAALPEAQALLHVHDARVARNQDLASSAATKDIKSNADMERANKFKTTREFLDTLHTVSHQNDKHYGPITGFLHGEGITASAAHGLSSAVGRTGPAAWAIARGPIGLIGDEAIHKATGVDIFKEGSRISGNAAKELIDIPANTIPSLYYGAEPAARGDIKESFNRLVVDPYKQLAEHPGRELTQHPLSSLLMIAGPLKGGDRALGRSVDAVRPRKSLARGIVPGTALTEVKQGSPGLVGRVISNKADRSHIINPSGQTLMTDRGIRTRVNESFDHSQHQIREAPQDMLRAHKKAGGTVDEAAREAARKLATTQRGIEESRMVDEFAARAQRGKRLATSGKHTLNSTRTGDVARFDSKEAADDFINRRDFGVPMASRFDTNEKTWKVLPQAASNQLDQFGVGHPPVPSTPGAKAVQSTVSAFRRTVLATPFTKWMAGNYVEAGLRSALEGVGPRSIATGMRANKYAKTHFTHDEYKEWQHRVLGEGHYSMDLGLKMKSSPEEYGAGKLAAMAKAINTLQTSKKIPPTYAAYKLWEGWTGLVFNTLNGKMERAVRIGMSGKALRNSPLMTERVVKLHNRAIQDAMNGARDSADMVNLGREVDRMFGKYNKFSPDQRKLIANYTPFMAWYLNAAKFVLHNLPVNHPVATALTASAYKSSQEWRKDHGLAIFEKGAMPGFLQGSIPVGAGGSKKSRVSHLTPFGLWGDLPGNFASALIPLMSGAQNNLNGKDWKGDDLPAALKDNPYGRAYTAALTLAEATVPGTGVAYRYFTGPGTRSEKLKKEFIPGLPIGQKQKTGSNVFDSSPTNTGSGNAFDDEGKSSSKSSNPFD